MKTFNLLLLIYTKWGFIIIYQTELLVMKWI